MASRCVTLNYLSLASYWTYDITYEAISSSSLQEDNHANLGTKFYHNATHDQTAQTPFTLIKLSWLMEIKLAESVNRQSNMKCIYTCVVLIGV